MTENKQLVKKGDTVASLIERLKPQISTALPKHLTGDRMARIAMTALRLTPKLMGCITAAQLGLEPNSATGQAYLIPYGKECQLIIGYRGLIQLAHNSGEVSSIYAETVHESDVFEYKLGLHRDLVHEPCLDKARGRVIGAYAVARMKEADPQFTYMSRLEIDGIMKRSKSANASSSPWKTDYPEMAKKTAIRRLVKMLPLSAEKAQTFYDAVETDDRGESRESQFDLEIDTQTDDILSQEPEKAPEIKPPKAEKPKEEVKHKTYLELIKEFQPIANPGGMAQVLDQYRERHGEPKSWGAETCLACEEDLIGAVPIENAVEG